MAPDSLEPPPPSPSAFPSLSPDAPSQTAPVQPSLSYAKASKSVLPPTKAPEGISLPPPPHNPAAATAGGATSGSGQERRPHSSKERLQPSQNGKHSPYARPSPAGAGKGAKKGPGAGVKGGKGASATAKAAVAGNAPAAEEANGVKQPRTHIPGMPASMLPAAKKSHGRKSSTSSSPTANGATSIVASGDAPAIGKKRRASLRKVLPPTASKLSALAPTFEFAPRAPGSSSTAVESSSSGNSSEAEGDAHARPKDETDLLSFSEKAAINDTVSSAGAQGDAFVAKSFSQADAEGAEAVAGTSAGEQSAKPSEAKAAALKAGAGVETQEKEEIPAEPTQERSFGALLGSAFVATDGTAFAPLSDLEEEDEANPAHPAIEQVKTERISGAVQDSPVADISWREKQGWWNDDFEASIASTSTPPPVEKPKPAEAGPAAVEPARSQDPASDTILRFPPWTPEAPSTPEATQRVHDAADVRSATPLGTFLNSAFAVDDPKNVSDVPTSVEEIIASTAASHAPTISMPGPIPLSSFLSSSFSNPSTPSALESFEPQAELAAERLAKLDALPPSKRPEIDFPISAEEVAAQPSLDDVLDVDGIEDGKVVVDGKEDEPKEEKYGWWSADFDPSRLSAPSKDLVDEQKIKETVQSAGAQGDEFRGRTFEQADKEGEVESAPVGPAEQSAGVTKEEKTQVGQAEEEKRDGARTPLGEYLGQAFSSAPSTSATSAAAPTASTSATSTPTPAPVAGAESSTPTASEHAPALSRRRSSSPPRPSGNSNNADDAPSLTLAIASAWHTAPWSRKIWAVLASLAINVGLPFVNGVMLGTPLSFSR